MHRQRPRSTEGAPNGQSRFNGRALKKAKGGGVSGNYLDVESDEEYWVSGVKKNGQDRQRAGAGQVLVEASALSEYLAFRGLSALNPATHSVTNDIVATNLEHFKALENLSYWDRMAENENA